MNCLEFRRRVGAEPAADDRELAAHRAGCAACARYQDELLALDALLLRALQVDLPRAAPRPAAAPPRLRWMALAASLLLAVAVGFGLWVSSPRPSLAREVMGHVLHEPFALQAAGAVDAASIEGILGPTGTRLQPGLGDVTFAANCLFEGRVVPHLVVQMEQGPVTVLLLEHRRVSEPTRLAEQGYAGVVLPAPRGSIAIVGRELTDLDAVAKQVFEAVEWGG